MFSAETLEKYKACRQWCNFNRFLRELEQCSLAKRRETIKKKKEQRQPVVKWKMKDLDLMEKLWVEVMADPDHFPPDCLPKSNLMIVRRVVMSKNHEGAE